MPRSLHVALAAATVTTSMLAAGTAAADPPPPPAPDPLIVAPAPPPAPPAPAPGMNPFAAASELMRSAPTAALPDLLTDPTSASQAIGLTSPSPVNPLAGYELALPHGFRMPSDDVLSPYALESGVPAGPFARLSALNGVQSILRGTMGRMPGAELGAALPGTAPPPDTRIPPGLEQFYIDPNLPPIDPNLPPPVPVPPPGG